MKLRTLLFISIILIISSLGYGSVRLYYALTDGFTLDNISSDVTVIDSAMLRNPSFHERERIREVLQQPFFYLDKGCQSYVFVSDDSHYVLKFIKHQRFRTKPWLDLLAIIFPSAASYRLERLEHKNGKCAELLMGWVTAFNHLAEETGLLWVHLDKTTTDEPSVILFDKMGYRYHIDLNHHEYLVQKRAAMFTPLLQELIDKGKIEEARELIDQAIALVVNTSGKGFVDGDPSIMQNIGIIDGILCYVDVGQFHRKNEENDPSFDKQDLLNKTYAMHEWLRERSPVLHSYLEEQLKATK